MRLTYRENRIRTCDPLVPNQVLYQTELFPDNRSIKLWPIKNAPSRSRTYNLLIRSQTLYPVALWVRWNILFANAAALSGRRDSNPRPPPWQGDVLPLNYFRILVPTRGFEPPTLWLQIRCSASWAKSACLEIIYNRQLLKFIKSFKNCQAFIY